MKTNYFSLFLMMLSFLATAQTIHTVDNRDQSGAMFTVLQDAIDAASAGDIIHIHPSPNTYGSVQVGKTLTIMGLGHNPAINNDEISRLTTLTFIGSSAGSIVKGLTISSINSGSSTNASDLDNIYIVNNNITSTVIGSASANLSDNWIVEGNYFTGTGSNITPQINSDSWQMRNNFMRGRFTNVNNTCTITNNVLITTLNTFTFFSNCNDPFVANNIFLADSNLTEIGLSTTSSISFVSNLTYNFTGVTINALNGSNNLNNTNPQFLNVPLASVLDFYNNDFGLANGSSAINAGSDGTDIGLTGNNFEFDNNGRPNLTPYPISITITNSVVAPGQNLNVEFSAAQKQ